MNTKSTSSLIKIILSSVMVVITLAFMTCDNSKKKNNNDSLILLAVASQPTKLILFDGGTHNGNLGGRSGADDLCKNSSNKPSGTTNIHAFISISLTDQVIDMPTNYGYPVDFAVFGPDGTHLIANNWADMFDNSINMSLQSAGAINENNYWMSGSNSAGSFYPGYNQCAGFIDASSGNHFELGLSSNTDGGWIAIWTDTCDNPAYHLLCIGEK
jgi:hypothetical protein